MKRKIFVIVGSVLVIAGGIFISKPLWVWIKDPSYTEMEMLLTYWREYLVGGILVITGVQSIVSNLFKS